MMRKVYLLIKPRCGCDLNLLVFSSKDYAEKYCEKEGFELDKYKYDLEELEFIENSEEPKFNIEDRLNLSEYII